MIVEDIIELKKRIEEAGVKIRPKHQSTIMVLIAWVQSWFGDPVFLTDFWTTLGKTIWYPSKVNDPWEHLVVIEHELVHIEQEDNVLGIDPPDWLWLILYLCFPVPIFFAWYRWKCEREAYLVQLTPEKFEIPQQLILAVERIVQSLWSDYGWCWPRFLMRRWFAKRLNIHKGLLQ